MSDYQKEAKDFCAKYNVKIISVYAGHRKYWPDDKTARAYFGITIKRERKAPYTFDFGQSLVNSYQALRGNFGEGYNARKWGQMPKGFDYEQHNIPVFSGEETESRFMVGDVLVQYFVKQAIVPPTEYDILAGITKNDPGTFDDFCSGFGYDTDSKEAGQTYFAVQKEWANINRLFSDCMDELQEIF